MRPHTLLKRSVLRGKALPGQSHCSRSDQPKAQWKLGGASLRRLGLALAFVVPNLLIACGDTGDDGSLEGNNPPGGEPAVVTVKHPGNSGPTAFIYFATLPPGSALPSGRECAERLRRHPWEPRPENYAANHTTGHGMSSLEGASDEANRTLGSRIDGNFTGTTDEILQWGACKWGFDEDILRAQAVGESDWNQATVGDNGESFGILQIKARTDPGTFPASRESTAFNVDFVLARWRICYEGGFSEHGWLPREARGDLWGCVGVHWSGDWMDAGARAYITRVRRYLSEKRWVAWGFPAKQ
jgi:hypothetical protein